MELAFATSDLEATAQSESRLREIFGTSTSRACQRLYELAALDTLQIAAQLPTLDLMQDSGSGRFSVSVCPTHRITFEPVRGTKKVTKEIDLASVTAIRILALGGNNDI